MYTRLGSLELLAVAARAWDEGEIDVYWILIDNYAVHVYTWN